MRILDFPHAVGYLSRAAQAALGIGSREVSLWLDAWAPKLKKGDPAEVLAATRALPAPRPSRRSGRPRYLSTRLDQIRYADSQKQGDPIGNGTVESANKLVVEQRLKGSRVPRGENRLGVIGRSRKSTPSWRCVVGSVAGSGYRPGPVLRRHGGRRSCRFGRIVVASDGHNERSRRCSNHQPRWSLLENGSDPRRSSTAG